VAISPNDVRRRHPESASGLAHRSARISAWRALNGAEQDVIFRQSTRRAGWGLSNFTDMGDHGVRIAGVPLDHGSIRMASRGGACQVVLGGESFVALGRVCRNACGRSPSPLHARSASLSAAFAISTPTWAGSGPAVRGTVRALPQGGRPQHRAWRYEKKTLLDRKAHHGPLKRAIEDALLLRDRAIWTPRGFARFVDEVVGRRNARQPQAGSRTAGLQALPEIGQGLRRDHVT